MNDKERMAAYETRRQSLKNLSDEELKKRFWDLCNKVVEPMVKLAKTHTSPSIERSVLMRMGIDSVTAAAVVTRVKEADLIKKGAGQVVMRAAEKLKVDVRTAAKQLVESPGLINEIWGGTK